MHLYARKLMQCIFLKMLYGQVIFKGKRRNSKF